MRDDGQTPLVRVSEWEFAVGSPAGQHFVFVPGPSGSLYIHDGLAALRRQAASITSAVSL